ncbi:MAG: LacI family transcriptional regulator [Lentisphaerae bacterium]|nr:MAG: LacI family transcriptional regulator [Lentisphaerota bacterium]
MGAILELQRQGIRIPEDLSIVGNGNNSTTDLIEPQLTKITCDAYEVGAICAQLLLDILKHPDAKKFSRRQPVRLTEHWGRSVRAR